MSETQFQIEQKGTKTIIAIQGAIDEDTSFPQIPKETKEIELNLLQLSGLNSLGIKSWVTWTKTFGPAQLFLRDCPRIIVEQMNMIEGFIPAGSKVESFLVPYFCEADESELMVKWVRGTHYKDGNTIAFPEVKDEKKRNYEMDVSKDKYFRFIKNFS